MEILINLIYPEITRFTTILYKIEKELNIFNYILQYIILFNKISTNCNF